MFDLGHRRHAVRL